MSNSRPFLVGKETTFANAYPDVKRVVLEVRQDSNGWYAREEWKRITKHDGLSPPRHIPCLNPRCQQGGLDLEVFIMTLASGSSTTYSNSFSCPGHEGSPKGRRHGESCMNHFELTLTVERKE